MYGVKSKIFLEFTKTQKSALCNFLRALVKNAVNKQEYPSPEFLRLASSPRTSPSPARGEEKSILQKFLDDEQYYFEINSPHFEFLKDFIDDDKFISETELYIKECIKYYDYKKSQEPLRQAQKEFDKKKRKFLQDVKMSKELPTKKQISYYNSLCKRYNIEKKDTKELSKLDLRDLINGIVNEGVNENRSN